MGLDTCKKCGDEVYIKYASKDACKFVEWITHGRIKAKDLYFNLNSGPIVCDYKKNNGGLHKCEEGE